LVFSKKCGGPGTISCVCGNQYSTRQSFHRHTGCENKSSCLASVFDTLCAEKVPYTCNYGIEGVRSSISHNVEENSNEQKKSKKREIDNESGNENNPSKKKRIDEPEAIDEFTASDPGIKKQEIDKIILKIIPEFSANETEKYVFQKATQTFIRYLTHFAMDLAKRDNKATISGKHVTEALVIMGFSDFCTNLPQEHVQHSPISKSKHDKKVKMKTDDTVITICDNDSPKLPDEGHPKKNEKIIQKQKKRKLTPSDYLVKVEDLPPIDPSYTPSVGDRVIILENEKWCRGYIQRKSMSHENNFVVYYDSGKAFSGEFDPETWRKDTVHAASNEI